MDPEFRWLELETAVDLPDVPRGVECCAQWRIHAESVHIREKCERNCKGCDGIFQVLQQLDVNPEKARVQVHQRRLMGSFFLSLRVKNFTRGRTSTFALLETKGTDILLLAARGGDFGL